MQRKPIMKITRGTKPDYLITVFGSHYEITDKSGDSEILTENVSKRIGDESRSLDRPIQIITQYLTRDQLDSLCDDLREDTGCAVIAGPRYHMYKGAMTLFGYRIYIEDAEVS